MFKIKRRKPGRDRRRHEKQRQAIETYLEDPKMSEQSPIVDLKDADHEKHSIDLLIPKGTKLAGWVAVAVFESTENGRQAISVQHPNGVSPFQVQDVLDAGDHFVKQQIRFIKPEKESGLILTGNFALPPFPGGRA